MAETFFGRITRHTVSTANEMREDRLTEVLAAVLGSVHGSELARHVALGWLRSDAAAQASVYKRLDHTKQLLDADAAHWTCLVRTQRVFRTATGLRRPDLELLFKNAGGASSPSEQILLWVELKHGAEPHNDQLAAYVDLIKTRAINDAAVLLVAPRSDYPRFPRRQMPREVPRITWEETARTISSFTTDDSVGRFLVDELLAYLREEGLMDPPELTSDHLIAFENYQDGLRALLRVCELADSRVSAEWGEREHLGYWPERRAKPREFWWGYPSVNEEGTLRVHHATEWEISWELFIDSSEILLDGRPGVPVFVVGLAGPPGGIAAMAEETQTRLNEADFRLLPLGEARPRQREYVYRVKYPSELFHGGELSMESELLAEWIIRAFADLAELTTPPPPTITALERLQARRAKKHR